MPKGFQALLREMNASIAAKLDITLKIAGIQELAKFAKSLDILLASVERTKTEVVRRKR